MGLDPEAKRIVHVTSADEEKRLRQSSIAVERKGSMAASVKELDHAPGIA